MKIKRCLIAALALMCVCLCGCNSSANTDSSSSESEESAVEINLGADESKPADDAQSAEGENDGDGSGSAAAGDLKSVYNNISSSVSLPEMVELNDKMLERRYGLTAESVADYAGGLDSSGVGQDEIVLIKAVDESKVEEIRAALQTYYDSKLGQQENYNPEEAEKIRNCSVEVNGLYVTLIVSNDASLITDILNESIN